MLGLRPRLRARHSLFDLIAQNNPSPWSSETGHSPRRQQFFDEDIDDLPPLPASPLPVLNGEHVLGRHTSEASLPSEPPDSPPVEVAQFKMAPVSWDGFKETNGMLMTLPFPV